MDEAAARRCEQRQIAPAVRARARSIVTLDHRQIGGHQRPDRGLSCAGRRRLQLLGEQVRRDVRHDVAEARVETERIGVEAVLEQANAGRRGGDLAELGHQGPRHARRRARARRERPDAGHRAARMREAHAHDLR